MWQRLLVLMFVLGIVADAPARPSLAAASTDALAQAGCPLCHDVPEVAAASREEGCASCHQWIREIAADPVRRVRARAAFPHWDRYETTVGTYAAVPSLEAAMARLEPAWVRTYLADPHDLRPLLPETMPRFDLEPDDLDAIVAAFIVTRAAPNASPQVDVARVALGETLFTTKGCAGCHSLGGHHVEAGLPLAPDLAHTRDRMHRDMVAAWIADPQAVSPAATMPGLALTTDEVLALRDYVLLADLDWAPPAISLPDPVAATVEVSWEEVNGRVFGRICVHCHMDPAQNGGRRGPGNAGGFGWAATGLELQTPEGVAAAADAVRDALLRRRQEARRDVVAPGEQPAHLARPVRPGMPLGLPPIPDADLALVLRWLDQLES